ncbi:hypothetical protein [Nonomuraea roseoviolacea]|uniref:RNA polymerase sigma-70 region 4 domain-containing protein n=1 Tax=Nonomuraea roseoviolacea subsp. carminata TaxID=160689 RepID=A0ABT1JTQ8_9ACTN|nr:hypothetical protein [Nonomuraea roseoviolacea]MCP2345138.1 hypothetical protein [Nonomuraea roseoviolacea subsp. carminata]
MRDSQDGIRQEAQVVEQVERDFAGRDNPADVLRRIYEQISGALQMSSDPEVAFGSATVLADALREMADDAALTRAKVAAQIREGEGLSIQALGERLGISKARADQLLRAARNG